MSHRVVDDYYPALGLLFFPFLTITRVPLREGELEGWLLFTATVLLPAQSLKIGDPPCVV
jgi:hypothetical protein